MTENAATMSLIAKELGISKTTVYRAFGDRGRISDKTRKKILASARKHHYEPNILARALQRSRTFSIGVIISDIFGSFRPEVMQGIEDEADRRNYKILIKTTGLECKKEEVLINELLSYSVDGLLICPNNANEALYRKLLKKTKVPILFFNGKLQSVKSDCVLCDDRKGAFMITEYLIRKAYRKIAFVKSNWKSPKSNSILQGYKEALQKHNAYSDDSLVFSSPGVLIPFEVGCDCAQKIINSRPRPDAVLAASDPTAAGLLNRFLKNKIDTPGEIAVAGFDNTRLSEMLYPSLTTVEPSKSRIGAEAVKLLLERIENGKGECKELLLEPELVIRESA